MTLTRIDITAPPEITEKAQQILESIGLDLPTAINVFLRQTVNYRGIPFPLRQEPPETVDRRREILRSLCGSIDDPTMVEPPEIEYESPREEIL